MPRLLGVLPTLQIEARTTQNCKFCQAFSADGLDFDFGSRQDSLLRTLDSNIHPLLMVPGLQVPEADSTQWNIYMDSLAAQTFLDGKTIMDFQPWIDRGNQRIVQERRLSPGLRTWLSRIAARWSVNGLVVPAHLRVELNPSAGSKGGYRWQIIWLIFDAHAGRLLVGLYADLRVETHGDAPPDRWWSQPFIDCLGKMLLSHP